LKSNERSRPGANLHPDFSAVIGTGSAWVVSLPDGYCWLYGILGSISVYEVDGMT